MKANAPTALTEPWTDMNPWTDAYLERELRSMSGIKPYRRPPIRIDHGWLNGEVACYMRRDLLFEWGPYPRLFIGDDIWMSMTPQEIESQYMPIKLASGRVGVGGLGLGYAAARIASKPEVNEVVVYETNPAIIQLWKRHFGQRVPKVKIVQQDVASVRGEEFDLFFNDVYARMWEDATWEHWNILTDWNDIDWYHPWGIEAYLMALAIDDRLDEIPFPWRWSYMLFLQQLLEATDPERRLEPGWQPHGVLEVEYHFPRLEVVLKDLASLRPELWSEA